MSTDSTKTPQKPKKFSRAPQFVGVTVIAIFIIFIIASIFVGAWFETTLKEHYVFFVGIPFAALIEYFLVATLESAAGKIEFNVA